MCFPQKGWVFYQRVDFLFLPLARVSSPTPWRMHTDRRENECRKSRDVISGVAPARPFVEEHAPSSGQSIMGIETFCCMRRHFAIQGEISHHFLRMLLLQYFAILYRHIAILQARNKSVHSLNSLSQLSGEKPRNGGELLWEQKVAGKRLWKKKAILNMHPFRHDKPLAVYCSYCH